MTTFFTSDVHFSHRNIAKFCPQTRRGKDVDEMNRLIIQNWQTQVRQNDTVYVLGDVFFCNAEKATSIIKQLPGHKQLIFGNHDKVIRSNSDLRSHFETTAEWREIYLPTLAESSQKVILHHYPTFSWKDMQKGAFHLYGHIHSRFGETPHPVIGGRAMDVGIDSRPLGDMTLWTWDEIYRILIKRGVKVHHGEDRIA